MPSSFEKGRSATPRVSFVLSLLTLLAAAPAAAQAPQPISIFAADVRGAFPSFPTSAGVATPRGLSESFLPSWGLGIDAGAHVYPLRWKKITFGFGASVLWSSGSKSQDTVAGATAPAGPTVTTKLDAFSPQVSFNFGKRDGFSYLSGGIGTATVRVSRDDRPEETGEGVKTINYGGGARWFFRDHIGVTFDLRFYAINPQEATGQSCRSSSPDADRHQRRPVGEVGRRRRPRATRQTALHRVASVASPTLGRSPPCVPPLFKQPRQAARD